MPSAESGWGRLTWSAGDWGTSPDIAVSVTGVSASSDINFGSGWGREAWGDGAWGTSNDAAAVITGLSLNASLGDEVVKGSAVTSTTGVSGTSTLGNVIPGTGQALAVTGFGITSTLGSVIAGEGKEVQVTGVSATGDINWRFGWGYNEWGSGGWGEPVGGIIEGTGVQISITGLEAESILSDETVVGGAVVIEEGQQADLTLNSVSIGSEQIIFVTGLEATTSYATSGLTFTAQGDAQISTAQSKFGGSSLLLDGTGDYVTSGTSTLGNTDFTVEMWIRGSAITTEIGYLWDNGGSTDGVSFYLNTNKWVIVKDGSIVTQFNADLSNDTWHHVAYVRHGLEAKIFTDGTLKGSGTINDESYSNRSYSIGALVSGNTSFAGYIDEFRASDVARYTESFTAPTGPFGVDQYTLALLHFDGTNGSTTITNDSGVFSVHAATENVETGFEATTALGTISVGTAALVEATGFEATTALGTITIQSDNFISAASQNITASVGNVTVAEGIGVTITGIQANTSVGNVTLETQQILSITGFSAIISLDDVRLWQPVNTSSTNTWSNIAA